MIAEIVLERQENRYATLREIGEKFGVTRQYVHKVLKKQNIPTLRLKKERFSICKICDLRIDGSLAKVHQGKCHGEYYYKIVRCDNCFAKWHMKRSVLISKIKRKDRHGYCSRSCYIKHRFYS